MSEHPCIYGSAILGECDVQVKVTGEIYRHCVICPHLGIYKKKIRKEVEKE